MDCARTALRLGAQRVTVAYRRTREEMPAITGEIEEAMEEGIVFAYQRAPLAFEGTARLEAVLLAEVEMGPPDEGGRRRPILTDRTVRMPCDHVLLALGQSTDLSLLPEGWTLESGRVFSGGATPVLACGDVSTWEGTVVHAIGDGHRVATQMLNALGQEVPIFEPPARDGAVGRDDVRFGHFAKVARVDERHEDAVARSKNFLEVNRGLPDAEEAARCFSCGMCTFCDTCLVYCPEGIIHRQDGGGYWIDYEYCKGCGLCVNECPRRGMEMST